MALSDIARIEVEENSITAIVNPVIRIDINPAPAPITVKVLEIGPSSSGGSGGTGATGADGASAYDIWISEGNNGTEQDFLDSLVGPAGLQGDTGPAGADGADGQDGSDATNPAFSTSVSTLAPGSSATVDLTGTYPSLNLAFGIPQGTKGDKGDKGDTGATGATGPAGQDGADGEQGPQGIQGPAGADGAPGADGADAVNPNFTFTATTLAPSSPATAEVTGTYPNLTVELGIPKGDTGADGTGGTGGTEPNFTAVANTLSPGSQATADVTGTYPDLTLTFGVPQGTAGTDGVDGKSAYQEWLDVGNSGTEQDFLDSLIGDQGVPGPQGDVGADGADGANAQDPNFTPAVNTLAPGAPATFDLTGFYPDLTMELGIPQGPQGDAGPQGPAGADGADGAQGPAGADGATGPAGQDGSDGSDGASAYEIAVANGFSGSESEWLTSLSGVNTTEFQDLVTRMDGLDANQTALMSTAASTEELTGSVSLSGAWTSGGAWKQGVTLGTNETGEVKRNIFIAPFDCEIISAAVTGEFTVAAHASNYIEFRLIRQRAGAGSFAKIDTSAQTMSANRPLSFDNVVFDSQKDFIKDDVLIIAIKPYNNIVFKLPLVVTFRYRPI